MSAVPWYLSKPVPVKEQRTPIMDAVERLWRMRPCFVCETRGGCRHREFDVDAAEVEAKQIRSGK